MPQHAMHTVKAIGHSVQGVPIYAHYWNVSPAPEDAPAQAVDALILGAFHGDEPESAELCFRLLHDLQSNANFLPRKRLVIVPITNPDGLLAKTRKNANAVDINRNFETPNWEASEREAHYHGGKLPFSEPETRMVASLFRRFAPRLVLTYHTPYRLINFDGPAPFTNKLAETYAAACGYPCEASIGYPTPGSFGHWAGILKQLPVLTVELPEGEAMQELWPEQRRAIEAVFHQL